MAIIFPLNDRKTKYWMINPINRKLYFEIRTATKRKNRREIDFQDQEFKREFGQFVSPRKLATFMRLVIFKHPEVRYNFLKELYGVRQREQLMSMIQDITEFLDKDEKERILMLFSFLKLYTPKFEKEFKKSVKNG